MNILVVSSMSWDDTNSIGNTFSNWFGGNTWKDDTFYHLYLRKQSPDNKICNYYYQISVFDIINPFLKKEEIGRCFHYSKGETCFDDVSQKNEKNLIKLLHKIPMGFIYSFVDSAYRSKRWENNKLYNFIKASNIDVVFVCVTDVSFLSCFVDYIREKTEAKVVLYIPDDMKGRFEKTCLLRRKKLLLELKGIINNSDLMFCASSKLAEYYFKEYKKKALEIYKGCNIAPHINKNVGSTLKIVYAGSLFYGRDAVIRMLIKNIELFNKYNVQKYFLDIYCDDNMLQSEKDSFNIDGVSHFNGRLPYELICDKLKDYDLFLIPESFDETNKVFTKYSFSTKIPESLQSGINILAIGPNDVSSMTFLSGLPFVYYADSKDSIYKILEKISNEKDDLIKKRSESILFAKEKFDLENNRLSIRKAIMSTYIDCG